MSESLFLLIPLSLLFLYVAVRLATAAYFRSKHQYESERNHDRPLPHQRPR